jgi:CRISPR-associated protein (TIGR02710 family)
LTFEPAGFRASLLLDSAVTLMRQYRFDAVQQLLAEMPEHLLSDTEKASRTGLLSLADAYSHWDLFCHTHFQGEYSKARFGGDPALGQFKAQSETVRAVLELGKTLAAGKLSDLAVIDLINNARRRIEEGKYDDATARLYRACEMLAQWRLASSHGIDSANVDLSKVPNGSKHWLETCRSPKGDIHVGLRKAYRLLDEMQDPLGKQFTADKTLPGVLRERNESILAHGTKPVEPSACSKLLGLVELLTKGAIADYESKTALLRFPWSR